MADPDPHMSPDDMRRAYMGPSATTGPEAAPKCMICGKTLKDYESSACMSCESVARARNERQEAERSTKMRNAFFAGPEEDSPELHRELAAAKQSQIRSLCAGAPRTITERSDGGQV